MANRIFRDSMPGGTGVLFGWLALVVGIAAGVIAIFEGASMLPFAVGLAFAGAIWIVHGKHLGRRPAHDIDVDANGLHLMPEGRRVEADGLGRLVILEREVVSSQVNVAYRATVYALTADVALLRISARTQESVPRC